MKRSAIKRGKPLARGKRLQSGKPMKRGATLRAKGKSRFPKRRDDVDGRFSGWIRNQPCLVQQHLPGIWKLFDGRRVHHERCAGTMEADHVTTRGAGGWDLGNLIPLCQQHHAWRHRFGVESFAQILGIDLKAEAARLYQTYLRETGRE